MSRKIMKGAVGAAAVAAVGGFALGVGSGTGGSATGAGTAPESAPNRPFAVFRSGSGATPGVVPPGFAESYRSKGLDVTKTRSVTASDGTEVLVTPGADLTCLVAKTSIAAAYVGSCVPNSTADTEGVFAVLHPAPSDTATPGTVAIVGLVPDGATEVNLVDRGGSGAAAPVRSNVVSAVRATVPDQIKFRDKTGAQRTVDLEAS